jgi:hypothetical protein
VFLPEGRWSMNMVQRGAMDAAGSRWRECREMGGEQVKGAIDGQTYNPGEAEDAKLSKKAAQANSTCSLNARFSFVLSLCPCLMDASGFT